MQSWLKQALRRLLVNPHGASRILLGPNRGCRMRGVSAAHVLGRTERHLQAILAQRLRRGMVVMDVGANIGYFTLMMSRAIGPSGRVLAFEPIPATYADLAHNVAANDAANVETFNCALSDRAGTLEFRIPRGAAAMASYHWHQGETDVERIAVKATVADELLAGRRVDFVKIDVEGAEGDVVRGLREIIAQHRPEIFIECSEIGRETVWSALRALRYRCFLAQAPSREIVRYEDYRHNDFFWRPDAGQIKTG
jgi:FkbM family methyltransferase